ncbi:MAG: TraX family protein [Acutalibacteraceae bacterium]
MTKPLNRNIIKYIAVFAMLLDHIAWTFLSFNTPTAQVFHIIGRITAPVMCFFLAQGYEHTRSFKKYALRLFIFAVISEVPWWLMRGEELFSLSFNMIFTLFLSLLAIHVEATGKNTAEKVLLIGLICVLSYWCDWKYFAVLWSVGFYKYRDSIKKCCIWQAVVGLLYCLYAFYGSFSSSGGVLHALMSCAFSLGTFLSVPLLLSYNGESGKNTKGGKWFFYIFYPLHMTVLGIIHIFVR